MSKNARWVNMYKRCRIKNQSWHENCSIYMHEAKRELLKNMGGKEVAAFTQGKDQHYRKRKR
jgi:hypothetical protein